MGIGVQVHCALLGFGGFYSSLFRYNFYLFIYFTLFQLFNCSYLNLRVLPLLILFPILPGEQGGNQASGISCQLGLNSESS